MTEKSTSSAGFYMLPRILQTKLLIHFDIVVKCEENEFDR